MHHTSLNYLYKKRLTEGAAGLLALLALLTALTACQHDDEVPAPAYEDRYVPLQISIPASEALKRSLGDPGSDARLPLPDYLYVYTAFTNESGGTVEVLYSEYEHIREHWTADSTGGNVYVYNYTDEINLPLIDGATNAYCYIIASADDLSEYLPGDAGNTQSQKDLPEDRNSIENITLPMKAQSGDHSISLRDLYSSYKGTDDGAFKVTDYGQKQSEVTGTLYHVAAKVDIQWNFTEEFHEQYPTAFVNSITLSGIPSEGYLFKPTENTDTNGSTTLSSDAPHPGVAVYGREDTYIWQPPQGKFRYTIGIGKTLSSYPEQTYDPGADYNADEVAYYRLHVTLTGLPTGSGN